MRGLAARMRSQNRRSTRQASSGQFWPPSHPGGRWPGEACRRAGGRRAKGQGPGARARERGRGCGGAGGDGWRVPKKTRGPIRPAGQPTIDIGRGGLLPTGTWSPSHPSPFSYSRFPALVNLPPPIYPILAGSPSPAPVTLFNPHSRFPPAARALPASSRPALFSSTRPTRPRP